MLRDAPGWNASGPTGTNKSIGNVTSPTPLQIQRQQAARLQMSKECAKTYRGS